MGFNSKMRKDRSGISTILIVAVIIVVVIIGAAAAYFVLSGGEKEETWAPGTMMKYEETSDILEGPVITVQTIIGQNNSMYFIMITSEGSDLIQYDVSPKDDPEDMEIIGTEEIDTIDGLLTLSVVTYTIPESNYGPQTVKSYVDLETGIAYKNEGTFAHPVTGEDITVVQILKDYDIVLQTSYKQSKSIGKTYEYVFEIGTESFSANIVCVADCLDGQLGVMYDFIDGGKLYFLSDNIQGLPVDAVNTEATDELETIDGNKTLELWVLPVPYSMIFCYEPNTHIVYAFVMVISEEVGLVYELVKKA